MGSLSVTTDPKCVLTQNASVVRSWCSGYWSMERGKRRRKRCVLVRHYWRMVSFIMVSGYTGSLLASCLWCGMNVVLH